MGMPTGSSFLWLTNPSFPLVNKSFTKKRNQPWLTADLKRLIARKNRLYKNFRRKPTVYNEINYKTLRSIVCHKVSEAKKLHYHTQLEKHKGNLKKKPTWEVIKEAVTPTAYF